MYRAENGNNVFHSRTLPHGAFKWTHSPQQVQRDGISEGGVPPKSCTSVTTDKIVMMALGEESAAGMVKNN
jgi:hypothetical protein